MSIGIVICLWIYFYTMGFRLKGASAPPHPNDPTLRIEFPPATMLMANGARAGIVLGAWQLASRGGDLGVNAIWNAVVLVTLISPLGLPSALKPGASDLFPFVGFARKWAEQRVDVFLKTAVAHGITYAVGLLPFIRVPSAIRQLVWTHFRLVPPLTSHLRIAVSFYVVSFTLLVLKSWALMSAPWPPWFRGLGPLLSLASGCGALVVFWNLSLRTTPPAGDWKAPGLGVASGLAFSFALAVLWARWDRAHITK